MNLIIKWPRPMRRWAWLGVLALSSCGPRETSIHVVIRDFDGRAAPVARLPLVLLPYDRDSVLAALAASSHTPRPDTHALDTIFATVRQPFAALLRLTDLDRRLRDSLTLLRRQTSAEPRGSPRYRELYLAFATAADSATTVEQRLVEANRTAAAAYRKSGGRLDQLRLAVTRWEDSTFRNYDGEVSSLARQLGRQRHDIATGADGRAGIHLDKGPWWIYARAADPADPNAAWYWNVRVTGDSIQLDPASAEHRPCYSTRCP